LVPLFAPTQKCLFLPHANQLFAKVLGCTLDFRYPLS